MNFLNITIYLFFLSLSLLAEVNTKNLIISGNFLGIYNSLEERQTQFDYATNFEEIVCTEKYFYLMCNERWQNVYLTLRAKVFRKPDIFNNDLNIFLFSDSSNIRDNFLSTHNIDQERIDVKNKKGECFRIDRYCPHQKADLCNAEINEDNHLICPVHAWKFDLNNGGIDKRSNLSLNSRRR